MKFRLIALLLTISTLHLTSCYNNFYLKEDTNIEELSFHISYETTLEQSEIELLKLNAEQFLEEYQKVNANEIKLNLISDRDQADLTLHVEKLLIPSKGVKILGIAISLGTLVWINTNPKIGSFFWPFLYFNASYSTTQIRYHLSSEFASFPSKGKLASFQTSRKWERVEKEKQIHLKHFDALLAEFFNHLNREYKKNQSK